MTEADPQDRERAEEPTGRFDPVARRGRVPGPVRQEDAVEPASEHLGHGRLRREHRGFDPGCGETAQDRALEAEVVRRHPHDPSPRRRRRTDEVARLVRFAGADVPRQVGALHPRLCSHAADERAGVEVARRDPAPHRAVFAEPKGQPPRVDALEADDARALELAVQRSVGPPVRCPARGLANDEAGDLDAGRLEVLVVRAVVALMRGGHRDHLPRVRGVGQHLLVPGHAGVEHRLPEHLARSAEGRPLEHRPVLEHEQRRRSVRHRCAFPSATTRDPR